MISIQNYFFFLYDNEIQKIYAITFFYFKFKCNMLWYEFKISIISFTLFFGAAKTMLFIFSSKKSRCKLILYSALFSMSCKITSADTDKFIVPKVLQYILSLKVKQIDERMNLTAIRRPSVFYRIYCQFDKYICTKWNNTSNIIM